MALIKCSECGRDVSDQAAACPNCGYPVKAAETSLTADAATADDITHLTDNSGKRKPGGCLKGLMAVLLTVVLIGVGLLLEKYFSADGLVAPSAEVRISASKEDEYVTRMGRERYEMEMEKVRQLPRLTVIQLIRFFEANEIAAAKQYKDQEVVIIGVTADISKSILGAPKITLRGTGGQKSLIASLKRREENAVAGISKGVTVTVKGAVTRSVFGKIGLKNGTLFDENDPLAGHEAFED